MTPRIKQDLEATPVEEAGVTWFDVSDPHSGAKMRLYDFEWLIAQKIDGHTPLDEVAHWTAMRFGWRPSEADLEAYAEKLREIGLAEAAPPPAPVPVHVAPQSSSGPSIVVEEEDPSEPSVEIDTGEPAREMLPTTPRMPVAHPEPPMPPPRAGSATAPVAQVPEQPRRGSGMTIFLVLVLLAAAGFAVWYFVIAPGLQPVKVKVSLAPPPKEVVRYFDGKGALAKAEPTTLSFGESGKVADVVAQGTEVKAGQTIASLEAAAAVAKDLADVKDRQVFYANQLKAAQAKGDAAEAKKAQEKVDEKKKMLAQLEERDKKVRLVAASAGTVEQVTIQAGAPVKEGDPAVKIADNRMVATFHLAPADAAALQPGGQVAVGREDATATATGRVLSNEGGTLKVELVDDGGGAVKAGDAVVLVKSKIPNVVREPLAALAKSQGGADQVFVLSNGVLHARPVTVVDKTATEVFIGSGLTTGESVVVSSTTQLQDGQKAAAE